jgi:hypothetical protein
MIQNKFFPTLSCFCEVFCYSNEKLTNTYFIMCILPSHAVSIPLPGRPTEFTFIKVWSEGVQISLKTSLVTVLYRLEVMAPQRNIEILGQTK